ncbi:unnamed protein product [Rhizophagus irregularis]|nr:unnamed protein product [Rhizophagus irregularis]
MAAEQANATLSGGFPCSIAITIAYDLGNSSAPGAMYFCVVENVVPALIGQVTSGNEQISIMRGPPTGCFSARYECNTKQISSDNIIFQCSNVSSCPGTKGSGVIFTSSPTASGGKPGHGGNEVSLFSSGAALTAKSVANKTNAKIKIRLMIT